MKPMRNIFYITLYLLFSVSSFGQSVGRALTNGNEGFNHKNYVSAEGSYRIANSKDPKKATADYNLGNALYRQKLNSEAETAYARAIKTAQTKEQKHQAYHNLGNAYMKAKNYKAAEEAYKNALRNNPKDDETRYNYAVAKKTNKENPDQNKDDKDQDKDNKDQDKDKKDQDKDKKDQNKDNKDGQDKKDPNKDQDKDNKDQNKDKKDNKGDNKEQDEQPQTPEQKKQQQSKEQIDRLLDAVNRDEKAVQQRLINKNKKGEKGKEEGTATTQRKKDW